MKQELVKNNITIIIPSLSPDTKLITLVNELINVGFKKIVVINDGSEKEYDKFFDEVESLGCSLCVHAQNKGKGQALKTAFKYVKDNISNCLGVITVDGDGQHMARDILRCGEAMLENTDKLVLGCRTFNSKDIPLRSRFGNTLTCKVFKIFTGLDISDTQTGLRAIPINLLDFCMNLNGDRFEYETNMLISSKEKNIEIFEVPIETVYLEDNKTSHFQPLKDSFLIYKLFFKFMLTSVSSFVIDIGMFSLCCFLLRDKVHIYAIFLATFIARIISSLYNYCINRYKVFNQSDKSNKSIIRYYILASMQLGISAFLVYILNTTVNINLSILKMTVDCFLFVISFYIQREWVFA